MRFAHGTTSIQSPSLSTSASIWGGTNAASASARTIWFAAARFQHISRLAGALVRSNAGSKSAATLAVVLAFVRVLVHLKTGIFWVKCAGGSGGKLKWYVPGAASAGFRTSASATGTTTSCTNRHAVFSIGAVGVAEVTVAGSPMGADPVQAAQWAGWDAFVLVFRALKESKI